ncbi:MAG: tetratricopeptide repeat protein [Chloroflexi bacterium]|nr:tetratricopeptide repeat protein [Chloroflexota bacterium]MCI0576811.1 tetratricopeptide repeat protein [Chloroflexota bacterium]MCI0647572.1 tetratricopeptide repeat protein [Chloroflexota bacterium]MCI0729106.1 tetratricopeptide repeat protein [Chloroflexota bacterium]
MALLTLAFLGWPCIEQTGVPVQLPVKAVALLAYLAQHPTQHHSRNSLALLLWPDSSAGRDALRKTLQRLRASLDPCWLEAAQDALGLADDVWVDVVEFERRLATCREHSHSATEVCRDCLPLLAEAAGLYRGDFLDGFALTNSDLFDDWQAGQVAYFRRQAAGILEKLARGHGQAGAVDRAIGYAHRWLALDPFHEPAHCRLMELLAQAGDRSAALQQYDECVRLLDRELGVAPAAETTALYERLRQGIKSGEPPLATLPAAQRHKLPEQATAFVGREEELAQIANYLADPACRLLTLVGLGGIGKTRLALQAAAGQLANFQDGVFFVPLFSLNARDHLDSAIARALNFSFYGEKWQNIGTDEQLVNYLRDKRLLLVLDNLEHLLNEDSRTVVSSLLSDILAQAPGVKVLATSRERLHLQGEWLVEVGGLPYPTQQMALPPDNFDAIQLFTAAVRRVRPDFSLLEEASNVAQICRLVEGMPLAIELAASWTRSLSCAEIARRMATTLDFLAASLRDMPSRHRSLRAIFDHSWKLLAADEQDVLSRLAVFRGDFYAQAAEQVARASLPRLASLVDKSLLACPTPGRYALHPAIHRYAAEKLAGHPDELAAARASHAGYYATFLDRREIALKSSGQKEALAEIESEIENVRAACDYIFEQADEKKIDRVLEALFFLYEVHGWLQEGEEMFGKAAQSLAANGQDWPELDDNQKYLLARALVAQGRFALRLSRFEEARQLLEQCQAICEAIGERRKLGYALNNLAVLASLQGDFTTARARLERGLAIFREEVDDILGLAFTLYSMGRGALAAGHCARARQLFAESLAWHRQQGYKQGVAISLYWLAETAYRQSVYPQAEKQFRESLVVRREIDDRWGIAMSLNGLGRVASALGDYPAARQHYQQSLQIFRDTGDRKGVATALHGLGSVAALDDAGEAQAHYLEALHITAGRHLLPLMLDIVVSLADLLVREEETEQAAQLLALAHHHPAAEQFTRDRAGQALAVVAAERPETQDGALEMGQDGALAQTIFRILGTAAPGTGMNPGSQRQFPDVGSSG